jgi:hypothetical protein
MTENLETQTAEIELLTPPPIATLPIESLPVTPAKPKKPAKAKAIKVVEPAKRQVIAIATIPLAEQKKWETRPYMRMKGEAPETVRHESAYGVNEAKAAGLAYMLSEYEKTGKTEFLISEIISGINSYGPAYGDSVRNGMKKLKNDKVIKIHKIKTGRAHYKVELLIPSATPVSQVVPSELPSVNATA